jgi:hypothetical protein
MYIRVYILWMNLIVQIVVPFLFLIFLNIKVFEKVKQFEQKLAENSFRVVRYTTRRAAAAAAESPAPSRATTSADHQESREYQMKNARDIYKYQS